MCLIAVAWRVHPRYPLALIANRDEAHARPTSAAGTHADLPGVFGGRDQLQGGSWLMVSSQGRLAAVTNVRQGLAVETAPRSRGGLVTGFLQDATPAPEWCAALADVAPEYGRFNLLAYDGPTLAFATNHPVFATQAIAPGVHAMSNGALDATWPKGSHATGALAAWLTEDAAATRDVDDAASLEPLFSALADTTPAPDEALPDTGVGLELERALSPPFIRNSRYGTRCSTVVLVERGRLLFVERRFGPEGNPIGQTVQVVPVRGPND
ncbi:NRDE family protein [Aerolutibacter ruishenii]|uniref:Uncharacterized protein with NRDE domain n=1 Tax=Aerolutibacter ruishenii TaxID=686800 RepID=A0A562LYH3_9GAMM|nr:NRDE family protein [Lysobacter ruishenii]TWI12612.1 uncharacterized protein with NRDE domain [Lysobacter ruishenii]